MSKLLHPFTAGPFHLPNRAVMAPMTRGRAAAQGTPSEITVEYYRMRADAALLITEATAISRQGSGWLNAPGIYEESHVEGWRRVTEGVHDANGRIFLQLWHMGRVSHPDFQADGQLPVGPSAIAAVGETHTSTGKKAYVQPRELETSELPGIVDDYRRATENALRAGFDGVEIHGANGYLLDQFLRDGSNHRTDEFGGSVENRMRFPLQVVKAVSEIAGLERTGIRISPQSVYNDMKDSEPVTMFSAFCKALDEAGLQFLHVLDPVNPDHMMSDGSAQIHPELRKHFTRTLIVNGGYTIDSAEAAIEAGTADLFAFGLPFLANPDLIERFRTKAELNQPDFATLYTPGPEGYIDYPTLATKG